METFRFCHIQSQVFPNCPYTANNLSVHYWYWTSKDHNKESNKDRDGKLGGWKVDQLEELRRVGSKVEAMLEEGEGGGGARSMGHAKLLHSVWLKLHPESQETEESLAEVNFIISKWLCIDACQVLAAAREPQVQTNSIFYFHGICLPEFVFWSKSHKIRLARQSSTAATGLPTVKSQ